MGNMLTDEELTKLEYAVNEQITRITDVIYAVEEMSEEYNRLMTAVVMWENLLEKIRKM